MILLASTTDWLNTWLTPLWLISFGGLVALAGLLVFWALLFLVSPKAARTIPLAITEGPLLPVTWVLGMLALYGACGFLFVRDTGEMVQSVARIPFTGTSKTTLQVPAAPLEGESVEVEFPIKLDPTELRTMRVVSDRQVLLVSPVEEDGAPIINWEIEADEAKEWDRGMLLENPFEREGMGKLIVTNRSDQDATVLIETMTSPLHPQAGSVLITAVAIWVVYLIYLLARWLAPKTSAIALATAKSEMAQPLYWILLIVGFALIGIFLFIPYHTFGEDIKVLKDSSLTLIMVFAIIHAVWAASQSVADEIEGKTALTVLSKPIGRRQFIFGKFFGISWSTAVIFIVLGVWLLVVVAYKPIYDARETSNTDPNWQECHFEMVRTVPGLFLAYLETLVFAAIGVAISTRLPMLANIIICFTIYAFGHLTPLLVQGAEGQFENVKFIARFIATILPVLDHFNIQAAVAAGVGVSYTYLVWATLYCAIYCSIAMLLALVLFEDRDLA